MSMFDDCERAGLGPSDLAALLGLQRVTVSLWFNGHRRPHGLIIPQVRKTLDAIKAALQAGDLPLPDGVRRSERGQKIREIVDRHLAAQQRAAATS